MHENFCLIAFPLNFSKHCAILFQGLEFQSQPLFWYRVVPEAGQRISETE